MAATEPACCASTPAVPCCGIERETDRTGDREILPATSEITSSNRFDHFLARIGVNRMGHTVPPGLYRLGNPTPASPVFASANYTLSFDALRGALRGIDGYILVLDTKSINVWCAAGKGTFGTGELVRQIEGTGLAGIVSHKKIIVPQLGAPGISWPEVIRRTGFKVEYGPVRARDLPRYLETHTADREMRTVSFPLTDRLVLAPVEVAAIALPAAAATLALFLLSGMVSALAAISAVLAGTVLFPALLPYLPTRDFSTKGFILGFVVAVPFALFFASGQGLPAWAAVLSAVTPLLLMPAVTAYLGLNFTGSTTFTSRTGVKKEIFRYVPAMALSAAAGTAAGIILGVSRLAGVV